MIWWKLDRNRAWTSEKCASTCEKKMWVRIVYILYYFYCYIMSRSNVRSIMNRLPHAIGAPQNKISWNIWKSSNILSAYYAMSTSSPPPKKKQTWMYGRTSALKTRFKEVWYCKWPRLNFVEYRHTWYWDVSVNEIHVCTFALCLA